MAGSGHHSRRWVGFRQAINRCNIFHMCRQLFLILHHGIRPQRYMIDISWPTYFAYPLGLSSGGGLSVTDDLFFPQSPRCREVGTGICAAGNAPKVAIRV